MSAAEFYTPEEVAEGHMEPLIEAEMALLGALMYDPATASLVESLLEPFMFLERVNGDIFEACKVETAAGRLADPVTIAQALRDLPSFKTVGGMGYLADLVDRAPPGVNAPDYARLIRQGFQRREIAALGRALDRAMKEQGQDDPEEILARFDARVLEIVAGGQESEVVGADTAVSAVFDGIRDPSKRRVIRTHLAAFDKRMGGVSPGQMLMLAGRPSMGKSAVSSSIARNVAQHEVWPDGQRVGVLEISCEMDVGQLVRRHISDMAFDLSPHDAATYFSLKDGEGLTAEGMALAEHCGRILARMTNLKMIFKPGLTIAQLKGIARRQAARWKRDGIRLGLVIVDHVGLMRDDGRGSRYEAQTNLAIGMKEAAGALDVALIALAQLSRKIEERDNKRPLLSDLRDSGAWEENADAVVGIYRDAYYANREPRPKGHEKATEWDGRKMSRVVEAHFLKLREGETGVSDMWGDMPRNAIRNSAPDNFHDGGSFLFSSLLDPDEPLPATVKDDKATRFEKPSEPAAKRDTPPATGIPAAADDGPPEPPLSAYEDDASAEIFE